MARERDPLVAASPQANAKPESLARISVSASSHYVDSQRVATSQPSVNSKTRVQCSTALPVLDLAPFIIGHCSSEDLASLSRQIADCLHRTSCLVVRDPRVAISDSDRFLDLVERYFDQTNEAKLADARPQLHFQVGSTPEGVELPKCVLDTELRQSIAAQAEGHRATLPPGPDCKWRFMWRIGQRPENTEYAELNSPAIIPAAFKEWEDVMNTWGNKMLETVHSVAELAAIGFNLSSNAFTSRMHQAPHLLAPTGCNLQQHGKVGQCIAGFHYDLNFLTCHGKSRFPGLFIWLRDGQRVSVSIPDGCLLLQAGKQLEWLTAGHVQAGMHEVICTEATRLAVEKAKAAGRPLWRVSSTVFGHVASDQLLTPLGHFAHQPGAALYPSKKAGEQVQQELDAIRLSSKTHGVDGAAAV